MSIVSKIIYMPNITLIHNIIFNADLLANLFLYINALLNAFWMWIYDKTNKKCYWILRTIGALSRIIGASKVQRLEQDRKRPNFVNFKQRTFYDALSDHLTDKGALIALELLSYNEHTEKIGRRYEQITNNHLIRCNAQNCR